MVYGVASRINKAHKPLQRVNAGSCLVQYYNIVSHKLISSGCKLCYIISQILRNKLDFLPWSLLFFFRTCLLSPEMFSKADPHKQLFQLLLAIQGLRKNLLYETMTQMAWESADILWCHLWFASKLNLRNKRRNLILMMHHYADLGGASDGLEQISHVAEPIRSTTLSWKVICHQLGVSALISQTSFRWRHKMLAVFSSYEAKHRPIVKA